MRTVAGAAGRWGGEDGRVSERYEGHADWYDATFRFLAQEEGSALLALVEPEERGDPQSPLRWTTKSLRHLAEELGRQGSSCRRRPWVGC
jgi:hypothetical protein